jgi:hypothetical protein
MNWRSAEIICSASKTRIGTLAINYGYKQRITNQRTQYRHIIRKIGYLRKKFSEDCQGKS